MNLHPKKISGLIRIASELSIRIKIAGLFALMIGLFSIFVAVYLPYFQEQREMEALQARAQSIGEITAFSISPSLLFEDKKGLEETINAARQDKDILLLRVQNDSGRVIMVYANGSNIVMPASKDSSIPNGYALEVPVTNQGNNIGKLKLVLSTERILIDVSHTREVIAIVGLCIFIFGIFLGNWVSKMITAQLAAMAETANLVAAGDFTRRVAVSGKGELARFANSFNLMVEKLESTLLRVQERTSELQREIAERKMVDEQLRKLYVAVEQSSVSVAITDRFGTVEYVNPKFSSVSGYSLDEIRGRSVGIVKSGLTPVSVYKRMWESINAGKEWSGDLQNRRKDGELFWEKVTISPIRDPGGHITHFLAVKEDITEKRQLEQQLVQSQKMDSIGTLAGGIAHDFNNILGIILGHLSIIQDPGFDAAVRTSSGETMALAVRRGANLVRQILTFARKTEVSLGPVSVNESIKELRKMLEETFPKSIEFVFDLENGIPLIIMDADQLHQALLNLCVNARDAILEAQREGSVGSTIAISTFLVTGEHLRQLHSESTEEQYIAVSIKDSGTGMDDRTKKKIFEPFFTTKDPGKGTGMGLSVVYGVMQAAHGFVDVQSTPGNGSTFTLYYPVPKDMVLSLKNDMVGRKDIPGGNETILVVEDEKTMLSMLKMRLQNKGYSVITATDGVEALGRFTQDRDRIDLVITDLGLPKMQGDTLLSVLRTISPKVKVLVASGYIEPNQKSELLKAGAIDIITKPYEPSELLKKVREVLDGKD